MKNRYNDPWRIIKDLYDRYKQQTNFGKEVTYIGYLAYLLNSRIIKIKRKLRSQHEEIIINLLKLREKNDFFIDRLNSVNHIAEENSIFKEYKFNLTKEYAKYRARAEAMKLLRLCDVTLSKPKPKPSVWQTIKKEYLPIFRDIDFWILMLPVLFVAGGLALLILYWSFKDYFLSFESFKDYFPSFESFKYYFSNYEDFSISIFRNIK